jgi:PP-loop superfamily ATP-utilizing enzyme
MLSGGKDSSALTYELAKRGLNILAVTVDVGFMSDNAKQNIDKLVSALDIEHIYLRPRSSEYRAIIDKGLDMLDTCTECSIKTLQAVIFEAGVRHIPVIYAGFTRYTAMAYGWDLTPEVKLGEFTVRYPYYEEYDLAKIRRICDELGLVFDPTQTNCKHVKMLIDRSQDNPLTREAEMLFADGQISQEELSYYKRFTEPGGR